MKVLSSDSDSSARARSDGQEIILCHRGCSEGDSIRLRHKENIVGRTRSTIDAYFSYGETERPRGAVATLTCEVQCSCEVAHAAYTLSDAGEQRCL